MDRSAEHFLHDGAVLIQLVQQQTEHGQLIVRTLQIVVRPGGAVVLVALQMVREKTHGLLVHHEGPAMCRWSRSHGVSTAAMAPHQPCITARYKALFNRSAAVSASSSGRVGT